MVSPYYPNQVPWTDKKDWVSPAEPGDLVEADHVNQLYAEVNAIGQDVGAHKSETAQAHGGIVAASDVVTTATADKILKLNANAKLPASITGDADTVDGAHAGTGANNVLKLDSGGLVPLANIPATLTGKSADKVDNIHFRVYGGLLQYDNGTGWKDVAASPIKSIQRGIATGFASEGVNVTINTVNIDKSILLTSGDGSYPNSKIFFTYGYLVSSTVIRFICKDEDFTDRGNSRVMAWQVIEYN